MKKEKVIVIVESEEKDVKDIKDILTEIIDDDIRNCLSKDG